MSKEKIISLEKYLQELNNRLTGDIPAKQKGRVDSYHNYLKNEIRLVSRTIQAAKEVAAK